MHTPLPPESFGPLKEGLRADTCSTCSEMADKAEEKKDKEKKDKDNKKKKKEEEEDLSDEDKELQVRLSGCKWPLSFSALSPPHLPLTSTQHPYQTSC